MTAETAKPTSLGTGVANTHTHTLAHRYTHPMHRGHNSSNRDERLSRAHGRRKQSEQRTVFVFLMRLRRTGARKGRSSGSGGSDVWRHRPSPGRSGLVGYTGGPTTASHLTPVPAPHHPDRASPQDPTSVPGNLCSVGSQGFCHGTNGIQPGSGQRRLDRFS